MSSHLKIGEEPLPNWGRLMNAPESGYGVLLIKNDFKYEGYWKDNDAHGKGKITILKRNENEEKAVTKFSMQEGFTVLAVGLVVPDKYWFLGVSPDGLIWNEKRSGFGIVEVKCIASCEDKKIVHVKQLDYQGELVKLNCYRTGKEEAQGVSDIIDQKLKKKFSLNNVSILVRAIYQTREFEERFLQVGIGYRVLGGIKFYERAEIKDAVSYLRIINQKFDDLALERIIGVPKRGVGESTLGHINRFMQLLGLKDEDWMAACNATYKNSIQFTEIIF